MTTAKSFFSCFLSLFLLFFLHLGCFFFSHSPPPSSNPEQQRPPKKRKISPLSPSPPSTTCALKRRESLSHSVRSYLSNLLCFHKPKKDRPKNENPPAPRITRPSPLSPIPFSPASSASKTLSKYGEKHNISIEASTAKPPSFASRADIYPCHVCGEVLSKPHLLDLHQATKHALSELCDDDSGKNIVNIIFHSGWRGKTPIIHRILKIHNTPRTLSRFEEYRESVKSKAARHSGRLGCAEEERCIAYGNERLRFYCSTILCAGGYEGSARPLGVCGSQFCSTCAIVRHGFSGKQANIDGIATHATSWVAHASLPDDLEQEFAFLRVRRAMLVCRVVAGRVARGSVGAEGEEKGLYDSVVPVGWAGGARSSYGGDEELLVFNPRAVLPCCVITYTARRRGSGDDGGLLPNLLALFYGVVLCDLPSLSTDRFALQL